MIVQEIQGVTFIKAKEGYMLSRKTEVEKGKPYLVPEVWLSKQEVPEDYQEISITDFKEDNDIPLEEIGNDIIEELDELAQEVH